MVDEYQELAIDLLTVTELDIEQARAVVNWLRGEGLIDSSDLREYYWDND